MTINMNDIINAALIIGGLGVIFGVGLALASKAFAIKVDERVARVRETLPGANCGACAFAGCDAYADSVVSGKAGTNSCPVGGDAVSAKIAEIMGTSAEVFEKKTARVMCDGRCSVSSEKYSYEGIDDCHAAAQLFGGHKACNYGCLGHGTCVRACSFDALSMEDGVAVVCESLCTSCGACVAACPKKLIEIVPLNKRYSVKCRSKDKGPVVKKNCDVGCIGCTRCVKACAYDAISMDGPLARIDTAKCTNCGECSKVCPTSSIKRDFESGIQYQDSVS